MEDVFTGTPASLTYDHAVVIEAWRAVWFVTTAALVCILGWMGLTLIVGHHLGREQAGWKELVPRLVLGLLAAATSLWWCALVIDIADGVSTYIATALNVRPGDLLRATVDTFLTAAQTGTPGMAICMAILYMIYGFFVLYVLIQMLLRIALIDLLLALAPIALGLWVLPHTAGWGRQWLRMFMVTVFQQAVQLVALALGVGFLNEFASIGSFEPVQDLVWKLLLSLCFIYLAGRAPALLGNANTFDHWLQTLHFGMSLPGSLVRSARTLTTLAAGAAGGPAGIAVAGGAAGLGASVAARGVRSAVDMASSAGAAVTAPRSSGE